MSKTTVNQRWIRGAVAAFVMSAAMAGCGTTDAMTAGPDLDTSDLRSYGYPAGPYAGTVGSVVDNIALKGRWSPTKGTGLASTEPFQEITFNDLRTSGKRYALVQLSAYW